MFHKTIFMTYEFLISLTKRNLNHLIDVKVMSVIVNIKINKITVCTFGIFGYFIITDLICFWLQKMFYVVDFIATMRETLYNHWKMGYWVMTVNNSCFEISIELLDEYFKFIISNSWGPISVKIINSKSIL